MMVLDENKSFKINKMGEHLSSSEITAIIDDNFGRQDSKKALSNQK